MAESPRLNLFEYSRGFHALTNMRFFRFALGEQRNVDMLGCQEAVIAENC